MSATAKIAAGVASGYLLGRTKKLKLAVTVGGLLAGKRIATNPQALLSQGSELVDKSPELRKLRDQMTGQLVDAARSAAVATATNRLELMSSALRGEQAEEPEDDGEYEDDVDEAEEPEDEQGEEPEADEGGGDEEEQEEQPAKKAASSTAKKSTSKKSAAAKKAPAKKAPAKKAPAKKSTAKKAPAKKSAAKKAPAKKSAAKKAPAKKSAAKKSTAKKSGSSSSRTR